MRPVPLIFINTEYIFCANELGWGLAIRQFVPFNVLRGWGVKSFKEMARISFCVTDLGTFFDDGNSSDYDSITCTCETSITFYYVPAAISKLTIFHLRCIVNQIKVIANSKFYPNFHFFGATRPVLPLTALSTCGLFGLWSFNRVFPKLDKWLRVAPPVTAGCGVRMSRNVDYGGDPIRSHTHT